MRAIPATPPTEADRAHYLKRLYVASESGIVAMFDTSSEKVVKLGEGFAGNNAHSIAVAPSTGLVYLPIRNLNGHPALRIMEPIPER